MMQRIQELAKELFPYPKTTARLLWFTNIYEAAKGGPLAHLSEDERELVAELKRNYREE